MSRDLNIKEHPMIKKIKEKTGKVEDVITLKGYVANSEDDKFIRLYPNLGYNEFMDIPKEEIISSEDIPKEEMEFGGTCIFIPRSTKIIRTKIDKSEVKASFLKGDIMSNIHNSIDTRQAFEDIFQILPDGPEERRTVGCPSRPPRCPTMDIFYGHVHCWTTEYGWVCESIE